VSPLHALLVESFGAAVLSRDAAAGTIWFRLVGDSDSDSEDLGVTLARDRCSVERAKPANPDLTVYTTPAEVLELLRSPSGEGPALRVHGRRELLTSLARLVGPPKSLLDLRVGR
jgi:hypothetical protein